MIKNTVLFCLTSADTATVFYDDESQPGRIETGAKIKFGLTGKYSTANYQRSREAEDAAWHYDHMLDRLQRAGYVIADVSDTYCIDDARRVGYHTTHRRRTRELVRIETARNSSFFRTTFAQSEHGVILRHLTKVGRV